jgi:hypothetical protein
MLREQSLVHSRLQSDLLWDLAGRIRRPIDPGMNCASESGEYYSCFISYSSRDQEFITRLSRDLTKCGVNCTAGDHELRIGAPIRAGIDQLIDEHDKVLLILSRRSLGSARVEREVEKVFEMEVERRRAILMPIKLDNAVMSQPAGWGAHLRRGRTIGDFRKWRDSAQYRDALAFLLRDLRRSNLT